MRIKRLVNRSLLVGAIAAGSAVALPAAAEAYTCKWTYVKTIGAGTGAAANIYAKDCKDGHYVKGKIYDNKADGRNAVVTIGYNDWGTWDGKGDTANYSYKAKTSKKSLKVKVKACKWDAAYGPLCKTTGTRTVKF
ncbi:hypothetical protein [Actinomadura rudentiformis]|uniref:Uncharacterized protein n=1 Tax=Actinomadura rudentiformis TaxID=359158 RepID=A0A6H9YQ30_9ACTN|nr:hypothetical protein [Actinomadura rudentiformis]KAB2350024.1 hypothetical protein F8566_09330 [Actinomadura rudentiformis]